MYAVGHKKCGNKLLSTSSPIIDQLHATAATAVARLSHCNSICRSICRLITWVD